MIMTGSVPGLLWEPVETDLLTAGHLCTFTVDFPSSPGAHLVVQTSIWASTAMFHVRRTGYVLGLEQVLKMPRPAALYCQNPHFQLHGKFSMIK